MMTKLSKEALETIYYQISPFEFKDHLLELARENVNTTTILDAGRGNPNWTASVPREAFFTLGQFAVEETRYTWQENDLGGMVTKEGIAERLKAYLQTHFNAPGVSLIEKIVAYGVDDMQFDADAWVYELTEGIIGCNYPFPDRCLTHIEKIILKYQMKIFGDKKQEMNSWDIFAVEGGTAAMCYLFNSFLENHLLNKGDKIALMTPIFTPYLEIPHLPTYDFEVVHIRATAKETEDIYEYTKEELDKLKDPSIKAVFIVNPNNPLSMSLDEVCKSYFIDLITNYRQELLVVTDDVYGTFIKDFSSLVVELPYNTVCVYSMSKYFGVTGWRLGTIMLHKENIFDELVRNLPEDKKVETNRRYQHLSPQPEGVSFMDRIVADSRQVALNHTAGLSTPQQVQMAMFCGFELVDQENNYQNSVIDICKRRKTRLFEGLNMPLIDNPLDTCYYTEVNVLEFAKVYDPSLEAFIKEHYKPLDFFYKLAKEHGIILLRGDGFASSKWGMRVSLANLKDEDYYQIGQTIRSVMDEVVSYKESLGK